MGKRSGDVTGWAIQVEGLTAGDRLAPAVSQLSLHVPNASIYGLVGPSGAGKSTALRVLATLQPYRAGTVLVDGIDLQVDPAAVRRLVGFLPDAFGLYDDLTVTEYLDFWAESYRVPARRRRRLIADLLELFDLGGQAHASLRHLPRGQVQRLGLARTLIHDPPILLLDEPMAGLDPRAREDTRQIMRELGRLGKTILVSSHLLSDLSQVCTHLGVMRAGSLVVEGPLAAPLTLEVQPLHLASFEPAEEILAAHPACAAVIRRDGTLLATFQGEPLEVLPLLTQLVESGIELGGFSVAPLDLEEMVAQLVGGEP